MHLDADISLCNPGGTLHGGFQAAIADDVTTYALIAADPLGRPGSTIDMSISCYKAIPAGARVLIRARAVKIGRTLAFCECSFHDATTQDILSHYKQTKFVSGGVAASSKL